MEQQENHNREHVIDIVDGDASSSVSSGSDPPRHPRLDRLEYPERPSTNASSSVSSGSDPPRHPRLDRLEYPERPSTTARVPISLSYATLSIGSNARSAETTRRGDGNTRRRRSPLNSGLWISIESLFTVCQIIASVVVLSLSRHEKPHAPLFAWVVGYASGSVVSLPILYWRYLHRNINSQQDSMQPNQGSFHINRLEPTRPTEEQVHRDAVRTSWVSRHLGGETERRLIVLIDHLRMALDCFFAVWFVVGNVWIFGRHSSAIVAPNLYRLCIVFLSFSCVGYAMPFLLCATICCCFPCIISFLGIHEDLPLTRGAAPESITVLPTYKFKTKKKGYGRNKEINGDEGGILAAGTAKERVISGEDAVCCICLAKYTDNEELRELPCTHFFHMECVDKWLKINASCPLCKSEVGEYSGDSLSITNSNRRHIGRRVLDGFASRDTLF